MDEASHDMIRVPEIQLVRVTSVRGNGEPLAALAMRAAKSACSDQLRPVVAVIAATFSNPERFPALSVRVAAELGLPSETPAFDVQMACSAYPYALYLAGKLAADLKGDVLVLDGDVQSPLVDAADHATGSIFSDAVTATIVRVDPESAATSPFAFLTHCDDASLSCAAAGPIKMDGMKVFTFVATEVRAFLAEFLTACGGPSALDAFVPHQANPYMIRQLAKSLGLSDKLRTLGADVKNPGSCSVPMTLAASCHSGERVLVSGFGAGLSASAAIVRVL